eukprot:Hpha_TRINITY_DN28790_c0_g1::TRINITY_DN28790_c0_g1_i1::g.42469::m.42469
MVDLCPTLQHHPTYARPHAAHLQKRLKLSNLSKLGPSAASPPADPRLGFDAAAPLAVGDFVEIGGLTSAAGSKLNNRLGQVVELPSEAAEGGPSKAGRYRVCIPSLK